MPPKTPKPKSLLTRRETLLQADRRRRRAVARRLRFRCTRALTSLGIVDSAEKLTRFVQRALLAPREALAPEYSKSRHLEPTSTPTARSRPTIPTTWTAVANNFADWKLEVGGLVENPLKLSLADLRAFAPRTQITRHDCVEGWSCIGEWTGAPLRSVLAAGAPQAAGALHRLLLRRPARTDARRHRPILRDDRSHRRRPSPDHPRLCDERRAAAGRSRRAAAAEGRAPARLQDGEICDADRSVDSFAALGRGAGRLLGRPRLRVVRGDLDSRPNRPLCLTLHEAPANHARMPCELKT